MKTYYSSKKHENKVFITLQKYSFTDVYIDGQGSVCKIMTDF